MIVLAIDAALGGFSAALTDEGRPLAVQEMSGNVALEQGLWAVSRLLREAGMRPAEIDRLGVGIGPGSFTGVRIAISYAKSLALGWRRPLVGVTSFDAIEAGLRAAEPLLTVVRGRKGVISVRYRRGGAERRASGYVNDVLEELGEPDGSLGVIGDAEDVLPGLAERGFSVQILERAILPTACAVAAVAASREPARSSHEVRADYGELPAAKVPKRL
ncbi:MAG TPA: tRNA (adenosine(37)-N6)-threonylcarbamoyltransferase complex dimerization subunit type 1 TsaB [Candidatus Baltobacteraceae bacterium]|nr:tRNA (adenosine(37)-N6)-threonylcarbamoyltransferase complex dimerization subunit type 1 TsaB [Candidatus Baltobacteraceae bacterium]